MRVTEGGAFATAVANQTFYQFSFLTALYQEAAG